MRQNIANFLYSNFLGRTSRKKTPCRALATFGTWKKNRVSDMILNCCTFCNNMIFFHTKFGKLKITQIGYVELPIRKDTVHHGRHGFYIHHNLKYFDLQ